MLRALAEVASVEQQERALIVRWRADVTDVAKAAARAAQAIVTNGIDLEEIAPVKATLEEVFADLTRSSVEAP